MGLTGKYDFKGIQKAGRLGIKAFIASTGWGAKLIASPFVKVLDLLIEWVTNWLANRGLIILNLGSIYISGEFNQSAFDKALDEGLKKVESNPGLSEKQKEIIDNEVKKAARKFFKFRSN